MSICDWDSEAPSFFRETWVKARKEHKCCECGEVIKNGDEYQYIAGSWEGDLSTFKTCERCADLRDALVEIVCPEFGKLKEAYWQYLELINNSWGKYGEHYEFAHDKCKSIYDRVFK